MELKLLEKVIKEVYPDKEGWCQLPSIELDEIPVDMVFQKEQVSIVAVMLMSNAFVSEDDVKLAQHLQMIHKNANSGQSLEVALVYLSMLVAPKSLPNGVSLISIQNDSSVAERTLMNVALN